MSPEFKLDSEVFKIKTQEEAQEINDTLSHYLEVIELNLACTIQDNFEEFHKAFKGFGAMKRDLDLIQQKAKLMKEANQKIQKESVARMMKVYQMQRRK